MINFLLILKTIIQIDKTFKDFFFKIHGCSNQFSNSYFKVMLL